MRRDLVERARSGDREAFGQLAAAEVDLREQGIPARYVRGFLPGERTGIRETVRAEQSQSWVEVFFPGWGWWPFDPTPRPR